LSGADGRRSGRLPSAAGAANGRVTGGVLVPDVVDVRLPRPYHFPAQIQFFQAFAVPFPGFPVSRRPRFAAATAATRRQNAAVQQISGRLFPHGVWRAAH